MQMQNREMNVNLNNLFGDFFTFTQRATATHCTQEDNFSTSLHNRGMIEIERHTDYVKVNYNQIAICSLSSQIIGTSTFFLKICEFIIEKFRFRRRRKL
jgi:hypothetical protein